MEKPMQTMDEQDDDKPVGRILSRREVIALLGGLGAALLVGCDTAAAPTAAPAQGTGSTAPTATGSGAAATNTPLNAEAATVVAATPVAAAPTADQASAATCV